MNNELLTVEHFQWTLSFRCYCHPVEYPTMLLTFVLLVANLADTKLGKKPEKLQKPKQMGTHSRVLSESYPLNTNN